MYQNASCLQKLSESRPIERWHDHTELRRCVTLQTRPSRLNPLSLLYTTADGALNSLASSNLAAAWPLGHLAAWPQIMGPGSFHIKVKPKSRTHHITTDHSLLPAVCRIVQCGVCVMLCCAVSFGHN